jgi:predicted amidohydrolase YtcJ
MHIVMKKILVILILAPIFCSAQNTADRAFINGKIYTADDNQSFVEAVAVKADTIVFTGTSDNAQPFIGGGTIVHDLDGKVMIPGIHDVHIHILEASSDAWGFCWINGFESDPWIMAEDFANCGPQPNSNGWIISFGFSIDDLLNSTDPPNEVLDAFFPDDPVYIMENTSHAAWVNSAALEELGIDSDSPDPQGGHIVMDTDTQEPNGILLDNAGDMAFHAAFQETSEISSDDYNGMVYYGLPQLAERGITSVCEGRTYWKRGYIETWQDLKDDGELTVRSVLAPWGYPEDDDVDQLPELEAMYHEGDNMLRVHQIKVYMDGITSNGTAALDQPYVYNFGWPFDQGLNYFTPDRLEEYITQLELLGFDFHVHAIGNRGVTEALDAIEGARNTNGDIGARHRVTHLELVNADDYERFAELNVTADMQVGSNWTNPNNWSDFIPLVGEDLSEVIVPLKSIFETGANVTLSSDWDAGPMNPFRGIKNAVERAPENLPSVEDAVDCYTVNGAWVMRHEHVTGSLEVGKLADLICIDRDIFTIPTSEIQQTQVTMTMLGGIIIHEENDFPSDIKSNTHLADITLAPTVTQTDAFVRFGKDLTGMFEVTVFDGQGKLIESGIHTSNSQESRYKVDATSWAEGVFVVKVESISGQSENWTFKLLVYR